MATATTTPDFNERQFRKRLAARVRQQRCRARKRQAKLAQAKASMDLKNPRRHVSILGGPVLVRSPQAAVPAPIDVMNRGSYQLMHHPASPFVLYPRRTSHYANPAHHGWPSTPPMLPRAVQTHHIHGTFPLPPHNELMARSMAGICRTPPMHTSPSMHYVPKVSPVTEASAVRARNMVPMIPDLDLSGKGQSSEETAVDAMLALHRS